MRWLRESCRLLTRGGALATSGGAAWAPTAAAAAAGPASSSAPAASLLQREAAALRRWLHTCGGGGAAGAWRQQQQQTQQCGVRQHIGSVARRRPWPQEQQQQRAWLSSRPRGRKELYEGTAKKVTDQGWYILATAVGMIGLTYAAVPLYRMFCQATGYGGTVQEGRAVEDKIRRREENPDAAVEAAAAAREVTIYFNSDVADGMPWRFVPTQRSVKLHPGQSTLAFYTAHNKSDKAITGVSTYNVAPQQAGQYFNKIQCFCFEEQKLRPGEKIDMPVFFYVDPEFATDPKMNGINTITLSYTFFKVDEEDWEEEGAPAALPAAAAPAAAAAAS